MRALRPFEDMWRAIGAAGDPAVAHDILTRHCSEPHRAYHNLRHVESCLRELDKVRGLCADPDAVEAATWFHDAIYDPRAQDNEERSAELALDLLALPPPRATVVRGLILDTRHAEPPGSPDGEIIADIDLAILGSEDAEFDGYCRAIRREYEWVDEATYRIERARVLRRFLARETIYRTVFFRHACEGNARRNLARAIAALG